MTPIPIITHIRGTTVVEEIYDPVDGDGYIKAMTYDEHNNCVTEITEYDDGTTYKHEYTYEFIYAPHVVEAMKKEQQR